jgi:hypothetical protein
VNGVASPFPAAGIYGSSSVTPAYGAGLAGPTTTIPAIGAGSVQSTTSSTPNVSSYLICPDSYAAITSPMIISETSSVNFSSNVDQDFNILLPTGYQFDVTVAPDLQLISSTGAPSNFHNLGGITTNPMWSYSYSSNTLLNIKFNNNNTGTWAPDTKDFIVISGLSIKGISGSAQGSIKWFYGQNVFTNSSTPTFTLATISVQTTVPLLFNNSYWLNNEKLFNSIAPIATPAGAAIDKTVNTIPDNYIDNNFNGQVQLLPDNRSFPANDYLASFFTGSGVSGDLFTLNAVTTGVAFNITMNHTDLSGCVVQNTQQYLVYDHRNPISNKLGTAYPTPPLAGTQQALVNADFPGKASAIASLSLNSNESAGYTLQQLTVDLPSSEFVPRTTTLNTSSQQIISGTAWRKVVQDSILNTSSAPNSWTWDYSSILNAKSPLPSQFTNVYDYFLSPTNSNQNNKYWLGGSLGKIEFTGIYQSTADHAVYTPFKQNVELFVPAVPVVEVLSPTPNYDKADAAPSTSFITSMYSSSGGYPGTATFCEHGGIINISGYPLATAGKSSGSFGLYNYSTYNYAGVIVPSGIITAQTNSRNVVGSSVLGASLTKFTTELVVGATLYDPQGNFIGQIQSITDDQHLTLKANSKILISSPSAFRANKNIPLLLSAPTNAFVDNGNGTMTINPADSTVQNRYKDMLITYMYQDNISPAFGIGYLVIRVTANPVPSFTISSAVANPGPSGVDAFCKDSPIIFNSSKSKLADSLANTIDKYSWGFGDQNATTSNPNTASTALATHTYNTSATFAVTLSLTSHWGCPSLPAIISNSTSQTTYAGSQGNVVVGDIPDPSFSFLGNCVGDPISFTDHSNLQSTNGGTVAISKWTWDFGDSKAGSGATTSHKYTAAGKFAVLLTATTNVAGAHGCQNNLSKNLAQLPLQTPTTTSAYQDYFTSGNGGWIALNADTVQGGSGSWAWGQSSGKKNSVFNSGSSNNLWVTSLSGTITQAEKSSLYSVCLDLTNLPRPMLSYSSFVDLAPNAEGLVLEYSVDNYNITDFKHKFWNVLGSYDRVTGLADGLDWYTAAGLPSSPGDITYNKTAEGWTGTAGQTPEWIYPKHELDEVQSSAAKYATNNSVPPRAVLRFALATLDKTNADAVDGVGIDAVFIGSRTRTIMFENFTTTDGGNATLNKTISLDMDSISSFNKRNVVGTQMVNINYHIGFLGMDPFNLNNPADPSSRALYYNIKTVPYAFLDGVHSPQYGSGSDLFGDWGQRAYDLQTLQLAKADFSATKPPVNNPDGSIEVDVKFTPIIDLPPGTTLQVAVVEEYIKKSQLPSGVSIGTSEDHFEYVLKKMIPNAAGTKFTKTLAQNTLVDAGSFKWIPEKLYSNQLAVVLFLQNENNKEIYQAEIFQHLTAPAPVTAIEPITADQITVYPNPSDQEFTIELPSPAQQSMRLTMANQVGQFTEVGNIGEGESSKKISTQGLAEGVYILQLGSNGNALRTKVIVLHK